MRSADSSTVTLVHPYPVPYRSLFQVVSDELNLPFVPYQEWERKLEEAASEVAALNDSTRSAKFAQEVPAATILEFFKGVLVSEAYVKDADSEVLGLPGFETVQARKGSPALQNARKLSSTDVKMWLGFWKDIGFLP